MNALADVAHTIQLSVAPVFLLAGIGALLNVVTSRLGRAVDRARALEDKLLNETEDTAAARMRHELGVLDRRMTRAQRSIFLFCFSALLICVLVAALFVTDLANLQLSTAIGILFISAMVALIGGLSFFLAEVTLATRTLRVRAELLMKD